ncbi:hypothetical protein HN371_03780 [Candidatus Poribacteria bacterium]|jgi:hypothetical protein|nr:hypothetical protein [Candidatus Poribacteria bacterium]MBT5532802.1 hypothetical protein [Candidatus Poribacteria bacterium]MBT5714455.1 hypothetical protein [Candidatus Poribacteria bacterium]MBT7097784.1 hypothetical protein [Candidatus Poribacteria bacterium]MBT7803986.1 hypothetical protein [Candidatus Poribacteria bacterium]
MSTSQDTPTHGFRHDPMSWAQTDDGLEAAIVREQVLGTPAEGDARALADAVSEVLAGQNSDGGFGDDSDGTAGAILKLLDLGVAADTREMREAGAALGRRVAAGAASACAGDEATELPMAIADARALCGIGETTSPQLQATLRWHADNVDLWINRGCPWSQAATITALAAGRGVLDIEDGLREALTWASEAVNGAGCISYFDPWSFVEIAATTDHPLAAAMLQKQLTLILRTQGLDGGWTMPDWWPTAQNSKVVFRALSRHGLLDVLHDLPPLPPGYKIGRTLATPAGDLWGLAWDGQAWWTCDEATNTAISFSATDGVVLRTVELPPGAGRGLGCWHGAPRSLKDRHGVRTPNASCASTLRRARALRSCRSIA